jgi:hypothetical protein
MYPAEISENKKRTIESELTIGDRPRFKSHQVCSIFEISETPYLSEHKKTSGEPVFFYVKTITTMWLKPYNVLTAQLCITIMVLLNTMEVIICVLQLKDK